MICLFKKFVKILAKESSPEEDFKKNYCKYSAEYKLIQKWKKFW